MQSETMEEAGSAVEGRRWKPVEGLREDIIGVSQDGNKYLMYNKALAYPYYTASK